MNRKRPIYEPQTNRRGCGCFFIILAVIAFVFALLYYLYTEGKFTWIDDYWSKLEQLDENNERSFSSTEEEELNAALSASTQELQVYENCSNAWPLLLKEETKNVRLISSNADKFTFVPLGDTVLVTLDENIATAVKIPVIPVPLPMVTINFGSFSFNDGGIISMSAYNLNQRLMLEVEPDPTFEKLCSSDARYYVDEWVLTRVRNGVKLDEVTLQEMSKNLKYLFASNPIKPSDKLQINLKKWGRVSYFDSKLSLSPKLITVTFSEKSRRGRIRSL